MSTITYIVKIASGQFTIDDSVAPKLTFRDGDTYVFDQADSSNSGHILKFSATSDNSGSSIYSTGVTIAGTAGNAGASTTVVTSSSTTDTLYYFSAGGSGYGSEFSNTGFKTSTNFNLLKPIVGSSSTAEKWGPMINHAIDQLDQAVPTDTVGVLPHIIPDVLYPAISGKLLDSTTSHSGAYGTAQSDSRNYYYTDILGSKPIKDPRIGTHFGSQRHYTKSMQILAQETAVHGSTVYSVDGREWLRMVGGWFIENSTPGSLISTDDAGDFFEITGYFNDINFLFHTHSNRSADVDITINGTLRVDGSTDLSGDTSVANPLDGRYVNAGQLVNGGSTIVTHLGTSPAINTLKWEKKDSTSTWVSMQGIELIAQDTTSTATKSKVQIPAQNVVSFGKKHTISATAQHFDPFNGFTSGNLAAVQALGIDDTTSLGLTKWLHSGSYYRPYNGGRVVKWINSSGEIKTSVTLMPPNAKSMADSSSLTNGTAKANASIANNTSYPTFEAHTTSVDEDLLDEVAHSYNWREFGNGAANGGTGGTYPDASMLVGSDQFAYVMDDGLTSLSCRDWSAHSDTDTPKSDLIGSIGGDQKPMSITWIGTGISLPYNHVGGTHSGDDEFRWYVDGVEVALNEETTSVNVAQNLPYGTHTFRVDCVVDPSAYHQLFRDFTFHQPKMCPIPQDAVIIGDFMLMADHVVQNDAEHLQISKGVRLCNGSRDHFYDGAVFAAGALQAAEYGTPFGGMKGCTGHGSSTSTAKLPFFGTNAQIGGNEIDTSGWAIALGGTGKTAVELDCGQGTYGDIMCIADGEKVTLGQTYVTSTIKADGKFMGSCVASPTHTSSHYQEFETPYLFELVGGDRNMEQNNLIVTADGQTWDEVTRDTSYLGVQIHNPNTDTAYTSSGSVAVFDEHRGNETTAYHYMSKNFAVGEDRQICLVDGTYKILAQTIDSGQTTAGTIQVNGAVVVETHSTDRSHSHVSASWTGHLKRGDCIRVIGRRYQSRDYSKFEITKLD